jgi:hypothetical protein
VSLAVAVVLARHHVAMALDLACPGCGTQMYAEQAHNRCPSCRYYEPCCDGAPQPYCEPSAVRAEDSAVTS